MLTNPAATSVPNTPLTRRFTGAVQRAERRRYTHHGLTATELIDAIRTGNQTVLNTVAASARRGDEHAAAIVLTAIAPQCTAQARVRLGRNPIGPTLDEMLTNAWIALTTTNTRAETLTVDRLVNRAHSRTRTDFQRLHGHGDGDIPTDDLANHPASGDDPAHLVAVRQHVTIVGQAVRGAIADGTITAANWQNLVDVRVLGRPYKTLRGKAGGSFRAEVFRTSERLRAAINLTTAA